MKGEAHVLVDVRPAHHYKIVALPNSINIPLPSMEDQLADLSEILRNDEKEESGRGTGTSLYVICRRGNDSQRAVDYLRKAGFSSAKDIVGGLESWAREVDPEFPAY